MYKNYSSYTGFYFSLRTSETNYLNEAFSFYAAIRGRAYYSRPSREDRTQQERSDLMMKKLRYYARFIVVCLLLKKMKLVRDLVRELSKHIGEFQYIKREQWAVNDSSRSKCKPLHLADKITIAMAYCQGSYGIRQWPIY